MYQANLEIESMDALKKFFELVSDELIRPEEKTEIRQTIENAGDVGWPCKITLEVEDEKWETYSSNHPDEAKVLEPHMKSVTEA